MTKIVKAQSPVDSLCNEVLHCPIVHPLVAPDTTWKFQSEFRKTYDLRMVIVTAWYVGTDGEWKQIHTSENSLPPSDIRFYRGPVGASGEIKRLVIESLDRDLKRQAELKASGRRLVDYSLGHQGIWNAEAIVKRAARSFLVDLGGIDVSVFYAGDTTYEAEFLDQDGFKRSYRRTLPQDPRDEDVVALVKEAVWDAACERAVEIRDRKESGVAEEYEKTVPAGYTKTGRSTFVDDADLLRHHTTSAERNAFLHVDFTRKGEIKLALSTGREWMSNVVTTKVEGHTLDTALRLGGATFAMPSNRDRHGYIDWISATTLFDDLHDYYWREGKGDDARYAKACAAIVAALEALPEFIEAAA